MICKLNSRALFFLNISLSNNHYSLKASWWFNSVTILSSLFLRPRSVEKMKVQWIFLSLLEMNSLKIDTVWSGRGLDVVYNNTQESCVLHVCESYIESCWQKKYASCTRDHATFKIVWILFLPSLKISSCWCIVCI